jgi:pimeloyl-ACP methyl ester carboxylesterase/DNA-binding CsgD family transcriptional regulator
MGASPASDPAMALIDALYGVAEDPSRWRTLIEAIDRLPPQGRDNDALAQHADRAAAMAEALETARRGAPGVRRSWDAVLLSADGNVRGLAGNPAAALHAALDGPLEAFRPLTITRELRNGFAKAFAAARDGKNAGLAHWTPGPESDAKVFALLMNRAAMPADLAAEFGISSTGPEPLIAMAVLTRDAGREPADALRVALGLTPAEWRLALALWRGETIAEAAARFGVALDTARTQVKSIFAKMNVSRQNDMIAQLDAVLRVGVVEAPAASAMVTPPRRFHVLSDGRRLAYREYGEASGRPVLMFHQWFAASFVPLALRDAVQGSGVRLIVFDRPGVGQSTPDPNYSVESVAADAVALADGLRLKRFAILGVAPGAPFALETARLAINRVSHVGVVAPRMGSGDHGPPGGPLRRNVSALMRQPWLIRSYMGLWRAGLRAGLAGAYLRYLGAHAAQDAETLSRPEIAKSYEAMALDAFETTMSGAIAEVTMFAKNLMPSVPKLNVPVTIWCCADDPLIPHQRIEALAAALPGSQTVVLPDAGLLIDKANYRRVLDALGR